MIRTFFELIISVKFCDTTLNATTKHHADINHLLRGYQEFALRLTHMAEHVCQVSNLAYLVFSCLCRIALQNKRISVDEADGFTNRFVPVRKKKVGSVFLKSMRGSVLWPIKQANKLRERRFGSRADETFLLCKATVCFDSFLLTQIRWPFD